MRNKIKVIVGGAPLTQAYADHIGADGFAKDASSAVRKAKELITTLEMTHE
jgi:5-methyltetrahydrofolate--homocysteine methyltransferase